jgi:hypothetical protein
LFVPEAEPSLKVGTETEFKLQAGDENLVLKGKVSDNEEAGTTSIEAELAANDPIFSVLSATDRFAVETAGQRRVFPLVDADVESFLGLCRAS